MKKFLHMTSAIMAVVFLPTPSPGVNLPQIAVQRDGQGIQITWTAGILQTAPAVTGPWVSVTAPANPHKVGTVQDAALFRVQQAHTLTVLKEGTGSGTVRSSADGIACGADCTELLVSGGKITLQALPDSGSTFAGWTGDCTGTAECLVVANGPKSVGARFSTAPAATPILNGGFEEGPTVGWQQQPGQLIFTGAELRVTPHSGEYLARLGYDQDGRRLVRIGQQITLPNSTPLFLNFALWIYSEEICDVPWYDSFAIYISGQAVVKEDRLCRGSDTGGWRRYSIDLTSIAGLTVPVVFEISSADALTSLVLLDDISISNQSWQ